MNPEALSLSETIIKPLALITTFFLGVIFSRLTMTKKELNDADMERFKFSQDLLLRSTQAYGEFAQLLAEGIQKEDFKLNDFYAISTKGHCYFLTMTTICDAILSGKTDEATLKNSLLPTIKDAANKSLPRFYTALRNIAEGQNIAYSGKLDWEDYQSIKKVCEKYKLFN